jgi:hypothetical protein
MMPPTSSPCRACRVHQGIAHARSGQRKVLGEGADHHRVRVQRQERGHVDAVKGQEAVGLVGQEEDGPLAARVLARQHGRQLNKRLLGVDDAGGVVGRVDEQNARLVGDVGLQGGHVQVEGAGLGRGALEHAAVVLHVEAVFDEVRRRAEELVAGLDDRAEEGVDGPCRAAGEDQAVRGDADALFQGHVLGQGLAHGRVAEVGHVAEGERLGGFLGNVVQALAHAGGRWQIRVAQAEVAHLVLAEFLLQLDARLEHAADPGRAFHVAFDLTGENLHGDSFTYRRADLWALPWMYGAE